MLGSRLPISRGLYRGKCSVISYKASSWRLCFLTSSLTSTPGQNSVGSIPTRSIFPKFCETSEFPGDKIECPMKKCGGNS